MKTFFSPDCYYACVSLLACDAFVDINEAWMSRSIFTRHQKLNCLI